MITKEKLKIYRKYHGDGDMWLRIGTDEEKAKLIYEDWKLIEDLVQDAILVLTVPASERFTEKFERELHSNCDKEETREFLIEIAKELQ